MYKGRKQNKRLAELKEILLARIYPENLVNKGIENARKTLRNISLLKVKKKITENRPICITKYDPRIPALHPIISKHFREMKAQDKYLKICSSQNQIGLGGRQISKIC